MCVLPLQVDKYDKDHPESKDEVPDQRKTSLQGALDVFDKVRGRATWSPPPPPPNPRQISRALAMPTINGTFSVPERKPFSCPPPPPPPPACCVTHYLITCGQTFWGGLNAAIKRGFKDKAERQAALVVDF